MRLKIMKSQMHEYTQKKPTQRGKWLVNPRNNYRCREPLLVIHLHIGGQQIAN